jgi:hypothetical protein
MSLSDRTRSTSTSDDFPSTKDDMENLFKWEYGQKVLGTHARAHKGMREYRRDIIKAKGKKYKPVYIDTLLPYPMTKERLNKGD